MLTVEKAIEFYGEDIAKAYAYLIESLEGDYVLFTEHTKGMFYQSQKYLFYEALKNVSKDYGMGDYIPFND